MSKIADWFIQKMRTLPKYDVPEGTWTEMMSRNKTGKTKVEKIVAFADMPDGGVTTEERAIAKERVRKKLVKAIEVGEVVHYDFCDGYCKGTIRVVK